MHDRATECGEAGGVTFDRGNRILEENPPQSEIQHDLTWVQTRRAAEEADDNRLFRL
jgi:hypothetical protein